MLLGLSGLAQANTVIFKGLIRPNPIGLGNGTEHTKAGLAFTAVFQERWGQNDSRNADFGGATLHQAAPAPVLTALTGGSRFHLTSFALTEADNNFEVITSTDITVSDTDGGGIPTSTLTIDAAPSLQT